MNDSQQRPTNFAPKPLEDAEVSAEYIASEGKPAGSRMDGRLIEPSTKFGSCPRRHRKVSMFPVAVGVLSLVAGASSARSQEMVADLTGCQ